MIWLEGILLTLMISVGAACGGNDLRSNLVPNRWILPAIAGAILVDCCYYGLWASDYVAVWLANMLLADLLAIVMYAVGLWAAGDVKLFVLMYLCVPGRLLEAGSLAYVVIPYLFIFVPALAWLFIDTLWQAIRHAKRYRAPFQWKTMLTGWLIVFLESTAFRRGMMIAFPEFFQSNELFCSAAMLVYAFLCSSWHAMRRWPVLVLHGCLLSATLIWLPFTLSQSTWWSYPAVLAVLLFQHWAGQYNYQQVPTSTVRKGMILSTKDVLMFSKSRVQGLPSDASENMTARLTEQQASAVKRWEGSANGQPEVTIIRKMPFAMLIAAGFALWLGIRIVRC